jgi:hypothetical protein
VNATAVGATPDVTLLVKLATGANTDMLMNVIAELLVPPAFVAFNITDQLPFRNEYVTFCAVENCTLVLFPVVFWNDHDQLVGYPDEVSLNFTVKLFVPDVVFAVKLDVGAGGVTLMNVTAELVVPPALVAFNITDQLPTPKV